MNEQEPSAAAVVRFASGDRLAIDDLHGRDLIDALMSLRNSKASAAACRVRVELDKPADEREDVDMTDEELAQLVALMSAGFQHHRPELVRLFDEAKLELTRRLSTD